MGNTQEIELPHVAMWRIHLLRLGYLLIATVMGFVVWQHILFDMGSWPGPRVIARSMLGALALMCVLALRYPLQMLPLMLFEMLWKTVAILLVILPAWLEHRMTPELQGLFNECIGIVVTYLVMPWRYVWARYFVHPGEPWRNPRSGKLGPEKSLQ